MTDTTVTRHDLTLVPDRTLPHLKQWRCSCGDTGGGYAKENLARQWHAQHVEAALRTPVNVPDAAADLTLDYPAGLRWTAREIPPGTRYADEPVEMTPGWWVIGDDPDDPDGENGAPVLLYVDTAVDAAGDVQAGALARALADLLNHTNGQPEPNGAAL